MKKVLFILLLLPFISKAQTLDSLVKAYIDASIPNYTFIPGKAVAIKTSLTANTYTIDISGVVLAVVQSKFNSYDSTINSLKGIITTLQSRPIADTTLPKRVTIIEQKIITGFKVTGVAQ